MKSRLQMHSDNEHVQNDADLARRRQHATRLWRKQHRLNGRRDEPEQRGPQQNSGNHLADHARLSDARHQRTERAAGNQDDNELHDELKRELSGRHIHAPGATWNSASISGGMSIDRIGSPGFVLTHFTAIFPVAMRVSPLETMPS